MEKIAVELGPVQETLLIPLLARAEETRRGNGIIHDPKAVEIVDSLDYDFTKWHGAGSLVGMTLRTRVFDEQVKRFLNKHPEGTVIEIGAGLNTRFERLDNGTASWIEFDLADSMTLRKVFFQDTERRQMFSGSVLDTDWHQKVLENPSPYCFVSEAVIIYLDGSSVERAIRQMASAFPDSLLVMDGGNATQARHHENFTTGQLVPLEV